jgi:hypothetical protein
MKNKISREFNALERSAPDNIPAPVVTELNARQIVLTVAGETIYGSDWDDLERVRRLLAAAKKEREKNAIQVRKHAGKNFG